MPFLHGQFIYFQYIFETEDQVDKNSIQPCCSGT